MRQTGMVFGLKRSTKKTDPCAQALVKAMGSDNVRLDAAHRHLASRDASIYEGGSAGPLCFPTSTAEVQTCVKIAAQFDRAFVARGAGTGLAGGAVPLAEPVIISTTRMDKVLEVDVANGVAWVQPGVVNLDLTRHLQPLGYNFAPDPSSQQVCTIGGNLANNAGGPHCLAEGTTSSHIVAMEVVLSDGDIVMLGGLEDDQPGYDLRGCFVGSEGMMGIATRVAVRLTPNRPEVATLLISFSSVSDCAATVGAIIGAGIIPAAIEMMDKNCVEAVEQYVHAGYPLDAAAVLLVEVDGLADGVAFEAQAIDEIAMANGASEVRTAADETERALLWKGRKTAFGAIANIAPDYYLHDTVVPRGALVSIIETIYEVADRHELLVLNVFHAGDGNLHPLLVYNGAEPGIMDRVHAAGEEIVNASLALGGTLSGEHGIGVEKRDYMTRLFSPADLDHQNRLRQAFDPYCRANPGKVLPSGHTCADIQSLESVPKTVWI